MTWAEAFFRIVTIAMVLGTGTFWGIVYLAGFGKAQEKIESTIGKVGTPTGTSKIDVDAITKAFESAAKDAAK